MGAKRGPCPVRPSTDSPVQRHCPGVQWLSCTTYYYTLVDPLQAYANMKSFISLLARHQPTMFKVSYTPKYNTFTVQHVAADASHPLHENQKKRQRERRREGLWWHVTAGVDLNKSSCVRTWARRRLRNAIRDELQQRGYDDTGKLVNEKAVEHRKDLIDLLRHGSPLDLTGSLRLHVQSPLIPAKYAQVRAQAGQVVELMLQARKKESGFQGLVRKTISRVQEDPPPVQIPRASGKTRPGRQMS